MIIFIAGHSYLGKLAAGFPNVMLQMQDPNHTQQLSMLLVLGHHKSGNLPPPIFFLSKIQQLNQPGDMRKEWMAMTKVSPAFDVESLTGGWPHEITLPCIEL